MPPCPSPANRAPRPPPRPWLDGRRCAASSTCSRPSLLLEACVYNVTRASSSVSWTRSRAPEEAAVWGGRGVCSGRAGRLLPLRTRATPSWTRTHPHFPGPTETRLALQPNSRKADSYEYIQGPGTLARLPHSRRSIIGGGCATAREAGALQVLITGVQ